MFHRCLRLAVLYCVASLCMHSNAAAAEVDLNGQAFTIPDGFTLELVAGPTLIERPVSSDLDHDGNLYVTEASGTNDPVQKQLEDKPHRVLRLTDSDGDGQYDKRTVFADRMMLPQGALWHDGSLFVAAPPSIWKLTDSDDDGVADERTEWFKGKTLTGCANDLHGPYLGRDGWIYWCKGAFAEQTYKRSGSEPFVTRAAHIFRRHPSGEGDIEPVMTGGMDNPVEVAFSLSGERFFTTTFLQHPGGGRRDGIIHAIYGGVYGKDHNVLDGHTRTGELMPVMTHLGAAAPSGLALLESTELGFRDQLVASQFNLRKVSRHELSADGGTYKTNDVDLIVSKSLDFHPTDVLEDGDGSLLIVDTGGWYKLCCPTSQLEKSDVLGGIYRLRRNGGHGVKDPFGVAVDWDELSRAELVTRLSDERPFVRKRARRRVVSDGTTYLELLRVFTGGVNLETRDNAGEKTSSRHVAEAVWALAQTDLSVVAKDLEQRSSGQGKKANYVDQLYRKCFELALAHPDAMVRQAALNALASVQTRLGRNIIPVDEWLKDVSLHVRRTAAEVISQEAMHSRFPPDPEQSAFDMLALAGRTRDRAFEHALLYSLHQLSVPGTLHVRESDDARMDIASALVASQFLDKSPGLLTGKQLWKLLGVGANGVQSRQKLIWIADQDSGLRSEMVQESVSWAATVTIEDFHKTLNELRGNRLSREMADEILANTSDLDKRPRLLRIVSQSSQPMPDGVADALVNILKEPIDPTYVKMAKAFDLPSDHYVESHVWQVDRVLDAFRNRSVSKSKSKSTADFLAKFSKSKKAEHAAWRVFASVPSGFVGIDSKPFQDLMNGLSSTDGALRATAIEATDRLKLTPTQCSELAMATDRLARLELPVALSVLNRHASDELGDDLLDGLARSVSLAGIPEFELRQRLNRFSNEKQEAVLTIARRSRPGLADQLERINRVLPLVTNADNRHGQELFHSAKSTCVTCHAIGYQGGNVGPDLTRIGNSRSPRDLLESILVPSASFVRSYEPWLIVTNDGRAHTGLIRNESTSSITLVNAEQKEVRISRDDVESMLPSEVSIMPAGLGEQVSDHDLADLVKFLIDAR